MTETPDVQVVEVQPLLLSVRQAAQVLSVSEGTMYTLCYKREIESVMVGPTRSLRRIPYSALQDYVERSRQGGYAHGVATDSQDIATTSRRGRPRKITTR